MVVCVYIPRFALTVAAGGAERLAGRALALAPRAGGELCVGEVSGAAEAQGVGAGMALAEALARCPGLELVPADPVRVAGAWELALQALEGAGAAVEPAGEGVAYFDASGLRGLYGSDLGTIAAARRALARPVRVGAGPVRFCALAAALSARGRRAKLVDAAGAHEWLAAAPVGLLGHREQTAALVAPLARLGVRTLGELRALGRDALADRFGAAGTLAYRLAGGEDGELVPRRALQMPSESLRVGDASSGPALERVLEVLVERLLARDERGGRTLRALVLSARLEGGGTWRERVVLREAIADGERIRLALSLRLALLPAPARELRLEVESFGPAGDEQHALLDQDVRARRERLGQAVEQVRAVAGRDAALRALLVDPDSRVPERRAVLAPLP